MITERHGNLLEADAEALVNTVNTVGVMGKGIALQFKRAYPDNFRIYETACRRGEVRLGEMLVVPLQSMTPPRYIINFPTKSHWRASSKLDDIRSGLMDLVRVVRELELSSIAVPPLGCGNGGLAWSDVYPLVRDACCGIPDTLVMVFPPEGAPVASAMPVRTRRPLMNRQAAAVLLGFDRYVRMSFATGAAFDETFSLMEAQKVVYFLQQAGWRSHFTFSPGRYGPYAPALDRWLSDVEGHYLNGYGDGTSGSKAALRLDQKSVDEAHRMMGDDSAFVGVLDRFEALVHGFESPYGIELLSTVHFIMNRHQPTLNPIDGVVEAIEAWSSRKRNLFRPRQAEVAYRHLVEVGAVLDMKSELGLESMAFRSRGEIA